MSPWHPLKAELSMVTLPAMSVFPQASVTTVMRMLSAEMSAKQ